jgi:carboxyl-terminal processing protease
MRWLGLRLVAAGAVVAIGGLWPSPGLTLSPADKRLWASHDDMLVFYEAVAKIQEQALSPDPPRRLVQQALKAYLRQLDPYSDYLPPVEYAAFLKAQREGYAGVGMEIMEDRQGRVICVPHPGSPAEKAGIGYGDILSAVDGKPRQGQSVLALGARVRGTAGSHVRLTVQTQGQAPRDLVVVRRELGQRSVFRKTLGGLEVVSIPRFTKSTAEELKIVWASLPLGAAKVMDLRGNGGGDLHASLDAAALFLAQDSVLGSLKSRQGTTTRRVKASPLDQKSPLYLWHDGLTASAAEAFIAALTQNGRAISLGSRTFGKGLTQRLNELTDGSCLLITYAKLLTPRGQAFDGQGLPPHKVLPDQTPRENDFLNHTLELINAQGR